MSDELDDAEKRTLMNLAVQRARADLNDGRPLIEMRQGGFTRAWAEAPASCKRVTEMEVAEFFYLLGVRDGHAKVTETTNADLKERLRIAQERIAR